MDTGKTVQGFPILVDNVNNTFIVQQSLYISIDSVFGIVGLRWFSVCFG